MIEFALLNITKGQVARYVLLPEVMPRLQGLTGTGFGHLAYFMALVYRAAGLIPNHHAYLSARNIGQFGIGDVIGTAARNLTFNRRNIDQVAIFFAILSALVILFVQFMILLASFLIHPATAQTEMPKNYQKFFITKNPGDDIAFRFLDRVFGVKGLFNSKDANTIGAFHDALHSLFQVYSIALLVIAVLIALYLIFAVVAETAQTGTPFGKRYNHVWAPIRLVVAIGLLVPIGSGLNSAQWITLYAAKFGSGFATNGWLKFNDKLNTTYAGDMEKLVAKPNAPEFHDLAGFMMLAKTCKVAIEYMTVTSDPTGNSPNAKGKKIEAWLVTNPGENSKMDFAATDYAKAVEFFNHGDVRIRFGEHDPKEHKKYKGYTKPYCGDLILQTTSADETSGAWTMQEAYYKLVQEMWKRRPCQNG